MDDNGKPSGDKTYKVEGHKTLAYDASVWVRLSRDGAPIVVGARSVKHGIRPGVDRPKPAPEFTVEWLVFDVLGCDPNVAEARDVKAVEGGEPTAEELGLKPMEKVKADLWAEANRLGWTENKGAKMVEDFAVWSQGGEFSKAILADLEEYLEVVRKLQADESAADQ